MKTNIYLFAALFFLSVSAFAQTPAAAENRVVFMGDSITDGWKLDKYFPGKPYVNRGIGGQVTQQMVARFDKDVLAAKPKVVVILGGINDLDVNHPTALQTIQANYRSMAEMAKASGIKVVLASVLPVSDYNKTADGQIYHRTALFPPANILALNKWLKAYCAANGHVYLDYFSAMADTTGSLRANLASDGVHPNDEGYKMMTSLASKAIQRALKK